MTRLQSIASDDRAHWGGYLEIYAYCKEQHARVDVYELAQTDSTGIELYRLVFTAGAPNATPINLVYGRTCAAHWDNLVLGTRHEDPWLTPKRRRKNRARVPTAAGQTTHPSRQPQPTTHRRTRKAITPHPGPALRPVKVQPKNAPSLPCHPRFRSIRARRPTIRPLMDTGGFTTTSCDVLTTHGSWARSPRSRPQTMMADGASTSSIPTETKKTSHETRLQPTLLQPVLLAQ